MGRRVSNNLERGISTKKLFLKISIGYPYVCQLKIIFNLFNVNTSITSTLKQEQEKAPY